VDAEAVLRERRGVYDAVVVSRIDNVPLLRRLPDLSPRSARIYDAEAIFALRHAGQQERADRPLAPEHLDAAIRAEGAPMEIADLVVTVSEDERALVLRYRLGDSPETEAAPEVAVWGHPVEPRPEPPGVDGRAGLLFVGYLGSAPNSDALCHFLDRIWPRIASRLECHVTVVGADPTPELVEAAARAGDRVRLLGYVEDLTTLYDRARVFIAPHRFGSGLPLKVVEALAAGLPTVMSMLLAGQLGITGDPSGGGHADGGGAEPSIADTLVADIDDADAFAEQVVRLYQDAARWQRAQDDGLELVGRRIGRARLREQLGTLIERAVERARARS
jgi:glycosyltransferase involved in cell wall biosynthesis